MKVMLVAKEIDFWELEDPLEYRVLLLEAEVYSFQLQWSIIKDTQLLPLSATAIYVVTTDVI